MVSLLLMITNKKPYGLARPVASKAVSLACYYLQLSHA